MAQSRHTNILPINFCASLQVVVRAQDNIKMPLTFLVLVDRLSNLWLEAKHVVQESHILRVLSFPGKFLR